MGSCQGLTVSDRKAWRPNHIPFEIDTHDFSSSSSLLDSNWRRIYLIELDNSKREALKTQFLWLSRCRQEDNFKKLQKEFVDDVWWRTVRIHKILMKECSILGRDQSGLTKSCFLKIREWYLFRLEGLYSSSNATKSRQQEKMQESIQEDAEPYIHCFWSTLQFFQVKINSIYRNPVVCLSIKFISSPTFWCKAFKDIA